MRSETSSFSPRPGLLAVLLLAACSGSSSDDSVTARALNCVSPGGGNALCLVSCNLGCSRTGCTVSDIAVNQTLALRFNQNIDPASVNGGTVALRTAGGRVPVGELVVQGNAVLFVPDIRIIGNQLAFGFENGAEYILTLPGGKDEPQTVRSTSGDKLSQSLNCFLNVTRGVQDLDGKPPTAVMLAPVPNAQGRVPTFASYVVEFSELLDTLPFQGANLSNGPVTLTVFRTQVVNGQLQCNPTPYVVPGSLQVTTNRLTQRTTVTLTPSVVLPGNVCVAVEVTSLARDLSGKPATRNVFRTITEDVPPQGIELVEDFRSQDRMDQLASGALWENGALRPAQIGGDGVHGQFVASDVPLFQNVGGIKFYIWSSVGQAIRADRNHLNLPQTVNDGVFKFSSFVIEADERVLFRSGDNRPIQIYVRGQAIINGILDVNGEGTLDGFNGLQAGSPIGNRQGQAGGRGGPGGGRGGMGGAVPGLAGFQVNGYDGDDVVAALGASHPYFSTVAGTRGRGSAAMPPNGDPVQVVYCFQTQFTKQISAGGSGGSFFDQQLGLGGLASLLPTGCTATIHGPPSNPGTAMQLLPIVPAITSREQFMIGGSGGGGAGVNPCHSVRLSAISWKPGGGGSGGGGVVVVSTGGGIRTASTSRIEARGGHAGNPINSGYAAPGGGGTGGTILLQTAGRTLALGGTCDVTGGNGGSWQDPGLSPRSNGGRGGAGYVRVEALTAPSVAQAGIIQPIPASAQNVGVLGSDRDDQSGAQTRWLGTGTLFPPSFVNFEVAAVVDGNPVVYSDDPTVPNSIRPQRGVTPVEFYAQVAELSTTTGQPVTGTVSQWLGSDWTAARLPAFNNRGASGLRWLVVLNRAILGPQVNIEVRSVRIRMQN